jgi:PEP-CTERM motif
MSRKLLLSVGLLSGSFLSAATITIHNTGVNGADVVQAIGSTTSFWNLASEPAGASEALGSNPFRYFNGAYYADNALSGWVSPGSTGNASVSGIYTYQLLINLTGFNPATASISGLFGTDNGGAMLLNGVSVATTAFNAFGSGTAFSMTSGFIAGINTISIQTNNDPNAGGNPTAFRVQFSSATADLVGSSVPEPSTFLLFTGGLAAAGLFRKRFHS